MSPGFSNTLREETIEGAGGLKIFIRSWRPDKAPRGVVVIVHGFNAHSGQYAWVAEELVAGGLAVYALDLRGRGQSDGGRFYVEKSRDPAVVQAMNDDPLITLPVLILHGTADKATKPSGSQLFYDTAGSTDKTLKLYEGYFHDPLRDLGKEVVMADVKGWIEARLPAA